MRLKTVYKWVFFVGFVLGLINVAVLFLKSHLSTTSPTATNTLSYVDHGRTYYMPPAIATWMIGLMIAYFVVFGGGLILAVVLRSRERGNHTAAQ